MALDDDGIQMPLTLTAENGAKSRLLGEFFEEVKEICPECWGDEDDVGDCDVCHGYGNHTIKVPVRWTTIKDIYARIVKEVQDGEITCD